MTARNPSPPKEESPNTCSEKMFSCMLHKMSVKSENIPRESLDHNVLYNKDSMFEPANNITGDGQSL